MKKVMIGILILIPIIVLFIVAMVSSIVTREAWIAVEGIEVYYKNTASVADNLSLNLTNVEKSFADYFTVKVMPENANRYTLYWEIVGDIVYTDEDYENNRNAYLEKERIFNGDFDESYVGFETENGEKSGKYVEEIAEIFEGKPYKPYHLEKQEEKDKLKEEIRQELKQLVLPMVNPAVMLVDEQGNEVGNNTTGDFVVSSYCSFSLKVSAENHSHTISVEVVGDQVERVVLSNLEGEDNRLVIGQSRRIIPVYTPIHSIVGNTIWRSDNEGVATVDQNGVITARGVGSANIYVKASKHGSESGESVQFVESSAYTVEVSADNCGSVKFGNSVVTSKSVVTFEELGITEASAIEGCTVDGNDITITADIAKVETTNGQLTIVKCEENEIAIDNAKFFEYGESSFVLAVGDLTLKLKAVHKDMLTDSALNDIVWSSSNQEVATVDQNGEVRALSSGLVTITATANGKTKSVTLNVQYKLASMDLKTSNDALKIGIAQETVYASEKYTDSMTKVANSMRIVVQGEPTVADEAQLKAFYSAYAFEIVSGGEYAEFDTVERNRLIFKNTLEGKGKQNIEVKVSALYPKYEGFTRFTTKYVTITAVYGVEVTNIAELRQAANEQSEYVHRDGILVDKRMIFEQYVEHTGETYQAWESESSLINYAIVLTKNITYEYKDKETGEIVEYDKERLANDEIEAVPFDDPVYIYGDIYGNNHMISTTKEHLTKHDKPLRLSWGNITISNLIVRANDLGDDAIITDADDTKGFNGECMTIVTQSWDEKLRLENINIEYCIFENGRKFASAYNAGLTLKGCILRNMSQCTLYSPARMNKIDDKNYYAVYLHLTTENLVVSNSLGTFTSLAYDGFVKFKSDENEGRNRFYEDEEQNKAYYMEHFASKGINHIFNQKGFLDIYNWQDVNNATLIDTGNATQNEMIGMFAGPMIEVNSTFKDFVYIDESKNTTYFHMGFILTGLGGIGLLNEPIYTEINLEDKRFELIYTKDIKKEGEGFAGAGADAISTMEIRFYGYKADNVDKDGRRILPDSTYTMDSALIKRLHGN